MWGKLFSILSGIAGLTPVIGKLWRAVKKDVPMIVCPECSGNGSVVVFRNPDKTPSPLDSIVSCPICNGKGKIRETDKPRTA